MRLALAALVVLAAAVGAAPGVARDGAGGDRDEVRVRSDCAGGRAELRLRREDDGDGSVIEVELRIVARTLAAPLRVMLLHDRRLVFTTSSRRGRRSDVRVRRVLPDWPGRETVTARISGSGRRTCVLEASVG